MSTSEPKKLRIAAVVDILFTTKPGSTSEGRGLEAISEELGRFFASCDVVFANLESTFPGPLYS